MSKIHMLDQNTINKIAAGEVVERPSSVVKELVENAIDAGATAITVEIKGGGIELIRITDNGSGIESEDIRSAFLRHSTSKISKVEDLDTVGSLGFRGEALASISAVSTVELLTKNKDKTLGTRFVIEGGIEISLGDVGCPDGTTLIIKDLFYNTPVRKKFLKKPATEAGYVGELMNKLALGHPEISFKFVQNNKVKLHTSGNYQLKDVIFNVYGKDVASKMIPVHYDDPQGVFSVRGFLGKPELARANRNYENYFINGRYIKSKVIMKAIEEAYEPKLILHRFPFVVLHIIMKGEKVDVNVHPTKMDVRFDDEKYIYEQMFYAVDESLNEKELIPEVSFDTVKQSKHKMVYDQKTPEPFEVKRQTDVVDSVKNTLNNSKEFVKPKVLAEPLVNPVETKKLVIEPKKTLDLEAMRAGAKLIVSSIQSTDNAVIQEEKTPYLDNTHNNSENSNVNSTLCQYETHVKDVIIGEQETLPTHFITEKARKEHKIVGQLFTTYWIVELGDKYYIIDQHAAHERVLYERILSQVSAHNIHSQGLLEPMIVPVSDIEMTRFNEHARLFHQMGFEVDDFGDDALVIRAVPFIFNKTIVPDDFLMILDQLDDRYDENKLSILLDDMASIACKAAVKAHDHMSVLECHQLIDELLELENPFNCPHGRPTIISMTRYELEKKFKRIV